LMITLYLVLLAAGIFHTKNFINFPKYCISVEMVLYDDRVVLKMLAGNTLTAYFKDFGIIFAQRGDEALPTAFKFGYFIYYDHALGMCVDPCLDFENMERLIKRYREWCEREGWAPCAIFEGILKSRQVAYEADRAIRKSVLCKRGGKR